MDKLFITPQGKERLDAELAKLKSVERPAIVKAIAEARAHGDIKENAEYHSAKEKQGFIEARIRQLEGVLAHAEVFTPDSSSPKDRVLFGSEVVIAASDGKRRSFQLVSMYEADASNGRISVTSPLGKALFGKMVGEIAEVDAPAGTLEYEIIEVVLPA